MNLNDLFTDDGVDVKIIFEIDIIGESKINIKVPYLHDNIHDCNNKILFKTDNNFIFEKSDYQYYTGSRFVFNTNVINDGNSYNFVYNDIRKEYLKTLKKNLISFTSSNLFPNNKGKIKYYDNMWFVY